MAYKNPDMEGRVFPNDYKKSDNDPRYTGAATINGQEVKVSVWFNDAQGDKKMNLRLIFKNKEEKPDNLGDPGDQPDNLYDPEADIPF